MRIVHMLAQTRIFLRALDATLSPLGSFADKSADISGRHWACGLVVFLLLLRCTTALCCFVCVGSGIFYGFYHDQQLRPQPTQTVT